MNLNAAINQILVLFIIMFIGYTARKKDVIDEKVQSSISTLLIRIALPALVLSSSGIENNGDILSNMINILIITVISYILLIVFTTITAKALGFKKSVSNVFISLLVFANVGFMGYPVAKALFQDIGVFYTSVVNLVFSVFLWTYGVLLYNSKGKINFKNLTNIGTVSAIAAVVLFLFNIKLPYSIHTALDLTGKMTTPLSMLLIGALIAEVSPKNIFTDWKVLLVSFLKLLAIPIITAYSLKLLGFNEMVIALCTIMAAMPAGATNAIFAKEFDSEPLFASVGVFVSTLFSIITLPIIIYILNVFVL